MKLRNLLLPYSLLLDYSILSSLPYPTLPESEKNTTRQGLPITARTVDIMECLEMAFGWVGGGARGGQWSKNIFWGKIRFQS